MLLIAPFFINSKTSTGVVTGIQERYNVHIPITKGVVQRPWIPLHLGNTWLGRKWPVRWIQTLTEQRNIITNQFWNSYEISDDHQSRHTVSSINVYLHSPPQGHHPPVPIPGTLTVVKLLLNPLQKVKPTTRIYSVHWSPLIRQLHLLR